MFETLKDLVLKNWLWPVMAAIGGCVISRLWLLFCFKRLRRNLGEVWQAHQMTYGGLCYLEAVEKISPTVGSVQIHPVSSMRFGDIKWALSLGVWSWFSGDAAADIRLLKTNLEVLESQPNYLDMKDRRSARFLYKDNMVRFAESWDIAIRLTKLRYKQGTPRDGALEDKYGLVFDVAAARNLFLESKGIGLLSLSEREALISGIVQKVSSTKI